MGLKPFFILTHQATAFLHSHFFRQVFTRFLASDIHDGGAYHSFFDLKSRLGSHEQRQI